MQKKVQIFLFFLLILVQVLSAKNDLLLKKAAQLYDNEEFAEAKNIYDSLYKTGEYDKKILEKLVDISEKNNQQAEAIYFLRKIAQEYGGVDTEKRINSLIETLDYRHGVTVVENNFFSFWLKRNRIFFFGLIFLSFVAGVYCLRITKRQELKRFAYLLFPFAGFLVLGMLYAHFGIGKQAILIHSSGFYQQPAYAAAYQAEIFAPGSVLEIKEEADIWYKISVNGREFWIPRFNARIL